MKKKVLSLALALALCLGLSVPAFAASSDFTIENGVLTKYNGSSSSVTIPSSVTEIGAGAFWGCTSLTSVIIPDSVTEIGNFAFRGCTNLTSVTIPSSVNSYGGNLFFDCHKLTIYGEKGSYVETYAKNAHIPFKATGSNGDSSTSNSGTGSSQLIPGFWVDDKGTLTKYSGSGGDVVIPEGVTSIRDYVFEDCTSLTSVIIPSSVTSIGYRAFEDCTNLTSVTIPEGVTSISSSAFKGCTSLTCVTIPKGITSIESSTFDGCTSLTSLTIPDGVTSIGDHAFQNCTSLTSLIIPESVTSFRDRVFSGCTGLTSAGPIGGGYNYQFGWKTAIPAYAFSRCASLTSLTIPESVTEIGSGAFSECTGLTSAGPIGGDYDYQFGWKTAIPKNAFSNCSGLTSVTIPESVTSIGSFAFLNCSGLTSLTIPKGVTSIGAQAFNGCKALTSLTIPEGVTALDNYVFAHCTSLTSVTLPASIPVIGWCVFENCDSLKDVYYCGSESQWRKVAISGGNEPFRKATIHYNSVMPEIPTQPSITPSSSFTDVPAGAFYADAVKWAVEKGITAGTSATTFSPNQNCTVAQILTFLWRASGSPEPMGSNPFSDVSASDYYYKAALWAAEKGMVSSGTFNGNTPCTRSMAVTYMWKAAGSPSAKAANFTDVPVGAEYAQAVAWAVEQGVTAGTSATTFSPDSVCTRGQIVTFLYRGLAK